MLGIEEEMGMYACMVIGDSRRIYRAIAPPCLKKVADQSQLQVRQEAPQYPR